MAKRATAAGTRTATTLELDVVLGPAGMPAATVVAGIAGTEVVVVAAEGADEAVVPEEDDVDTDSDADCAVPPATHVAYDVCSVTPMLRKDVRIVSGTHPARHPGVYGNPAPTAAAFVIGVAGSGHDPVTGFMW
jgi:hypothetical protein